MQVMAHSAHACALELATACASAPLVALLCSRVAEDRSVKLRCGCCHLLTQVPARMTVLGEACGRDYLQASMSCSVWSEVRLPRHLATGTLTA